MSNPYYPDNQQWQGQPQDPYSGGQYQPSQPQTVYGSYGDPGQQAPSYPPTPEPYPSQGQGYPPQGAGYVPQAPGYAPQQGYAPQVSYPGMGYPAQADSGSGMAIAGLVLGIVSLVLFWLFYLGIPAAVVGIILSVLGRRSVRRRTMATVGLVLSILAVVLSLCFLGLGIYGLTHRTY